MAVSWRKERSPRAEEAWEGFLGDQNLPSVGWVWPVTGPGVGFPGMGHVLQELGKED